MTIEAVRRLELAGLAAWRVAAELRQVRESFPVTTDAVARQALEVEELARTLAGECAMRLREVLEEPTRGEL